MLNGYTSSAVDVSKQYVDGQARLASLKAQTTAMTRLLDRAAAVSDIVNNVEVFF